MENPLSSLHHFIDTTFDLDDLRTLCFELGVDIDNLPGDVKTTKVQALLLILGRRRQLDRLLNALRKQRPEAFEQAGLSTDPETLEALYTALPAYEVGDSPTPSRPGGVSIAAPISGQMAIWQRFLPPDHPHIAIVKGNLEGLG